MVELLWYYYVHNGNVVIVTFLLVTCPTLNHPDNGTKNCSLKDNEFSSQGTTCTFTCNNGYQLMGSGMRTCQNDGSWSGSDAVCISK